MMTLYDTIMYRVYILTRMYGCLDYYFISVALACALSLSLSVSDIVTKLYSNWKDLEGIRLYTELKRLGLEW